MSTTLRLRVVLMAFVVSLLATLVPMQPALAAGGGFDWTFTGKCCVTSRTWTTVTKNAIWIDVDSIKPCESIDGKWTTVRITLEKDEWWGWSDQGSGDYPCNALADLKWPDKPADNYRFRLEILFPHRDLKDYSVTGSVAYDGWRT